ncbi:MAG TPA: ATP-binding protein [Solirubrobacterales bacterium]|nr:ATP-binding protein [Solirubrobacterales bacterium]
MSRIPIRLRVTLAFTAAMALVLIATGLFLYFRLEARLDESIDNGLRSRATEASALVRTSGGLEASHEAPLIEPDESFAQVLTTSGQIVDSTPQLRGSVALDPSQLARVSSPTFFDRAGLPGIDATARLLAVPVKTQSGTRIVVVGTSLGDRDETLADLAALFLIGGPAALLLTSLAGYLAAGAALHPVESMRKRAAGISASGPRERLPIPAAKDELRRLGLTLNEMLERIDATLERERRFLDDASHELRTPLALHKTGLELALRQGESEEELRAAIAAGLVEVDRLVQLAEDLLVVARSEEGGLVLEREPLGVAHLLSAVAERFRTPLAASGRPLVVEEVALDLVISGDRLRLEQALTNLTDNAVRHGSGEIRLWAERAPGAVRIHVGDDGPGFPEEFVAQAFERFTRADVARTQGGAGLGLAIIETIARAHGGRAGLENRGGADVWIEIPTA